jgi:hypothetical protein
MRNAPRAASRAALAAAAVTAALALAGVAEAGGTHTVSTTDNFHGTQSITDVNPCTGNEIDLSMTTNMVEHVTYFPAGDEAWGTFTEEDNFTGVDQGTGVTYSGHATFWGGFNVNEQNQTSTFTSMIRGTSSGGTTISYHEVGHITLLPDGRIAVSFDKATLSCG